jgi:hypothetical protein
MEKEVDCELPEDICVAMLCNGLEKLANVEQDGRRRQLIHVLYHKLCKENWEWEDLERLQKEELYKLCYQATQLMYEYAGKDDFVLAEMLAELEEWITRSVLPNKK